MTQQTPPAASRAQRILSYIVAALVIVSLVCIAAILIGTAVGGFAQQSTAPGLWPAVFLLPLLALPIAFVLLIVLIVMTGRRRSAEAKAAAAAATTAATPAKPPRKDKG